MEKCIFGGQGVNKDYNKCLEIFKSLEDDSKVAQYYLGKLYSLGYGVSQNHEQAFKYYKASAEKNYPLGEYGVAQSYLLGNGVTEDIEKAIFWFKRAAEHGYERAFYSMGMIYYYGQDYGYNVITNKNFAIELLTKADSMGSKDAKRELKRIQEGTHYARVSNNDSKNISISFTEQYHIDNPDTINDND